MTDLQQSKGDSGAVDTRPSEKPAGPLLRVEDLVLRYSTRQGPVEAVGGVSFEVERGEVLGLVGESGSGKTSIALCLLKIFPDNASLPSGHIYFNDTDLVHLNEREMRRYRWKHISMIFQAAMTSLDPMYRVGEQIEEAILAHERIPRRLVRERVSQLYTTVGLDASMIDRYPHQYSGGMKQRAAIAMALGCNPDLIIADEPTTALDVITQHHILVELKALQQRRQTAMLYISHDLGVIASLSDRVAVMYAGKIVELAPATSLFQNSFHPYTLALISAMLTVRGHRRPLASIAAAEAPDLINPPPGCRYAPRCPFVTDICRQQAPELVQKKEGHLAACWNSEQVSEVSSDG